MDRFQPLDVSNSSLGAHLYPSEEVYLLTPSVGLYSGPSKSLPHSSGTVYLTSHRLFYVDDLEPHRHSCFVKLSIIRETEFYAGFLKSSPKITLGFREREQSDENAKVQQNGSLDGGGKRTENATSSTVKAESSGPSSVRPGQDWRLNATATDASATLLPTTSWVCRVCAFSNPLDPGVDPSSSVRCALCGVPTDVRDITPKPMATTPTRINGDRSISSSDARPNSSQKASRSDGVSCPICTFSNHPSMLRCEMCDSPLATVEVTEAALRAVTPSHERSTTPQHRTPSKTPEPTDDEQQELFNHVRLSFRKGGDKSFYEMLKRTLKEKRWQRAGSDDNARNKAALAAGRKGSNGTLASTAARHRRRYVGGRSTNIDGRSAAAVSDDEEGRTTSTVASRRVGIEGILSAVDLQKREESSDMQDALRDLEALMTRAKKMVDFAEALNAKLMRQESSSQQNASDGDQEAANMIRSSMLRLGLPTPAITADMARDEMEYNVQLARELAGLLYAARRPLIGSGKVLSTPRTDDDRTYDSRSDGVDAHGRGIMALDEVWCVWNRARGVALVSPNQLLAVLPLLSRLTAPPIACKTFSSGLKVLHMPRYAERNLSERICALLHAQTHETTSIDDDGTVSQTGISTLTFAQIEACPVSLMAELLDDIELNMGVVVRDEHAGQIVWHLNPFLVPVN